ncbi:MAG: TerC family protein [Candidatus Dasytiphilus stammeri]
MFHWILVPSVWISLITLISVEIILGIDNILLISFQISHLPDSQKNRVLIFGLGVSMVIRIILLKITTWILKFRNPIFTLFLHNFSLREIIFILGGLFLVWKCFQELHNTISCKFYQSSFLSKKKSFSLKKIVSEIIILDILLSIDSIITAISISQNQWIIFSALIISIILMLLFSKNIGNYINTNIFIKIIILFFLELLGIFLILEGIFIHIPRIYLYSALFFSLVVEFLNFLYRKNHLKYH